MLTIEGALLGTGVVKRWSHLSQKYLVRLNLGAWHTKHWLALGAVVTSVLVATLLWWEDALLWELLWWELLDLLFLEPDDPEPEPECEL